MLQNFAEASLHLKVVLILTVGFGLASVLGYFSHRAKLSSILGYVLAGYLIGPYSPGFVAEIEVSEQLAEIGVVLMMFGVGLQFKIEELLNVKNIAIPGAIAQTLLTTLVVIGLCVAMGWSVQTGIVLGLGVGVASTVMLVRVLTDNNLLSTKRGHIAVGWLVVEDIITVFVLILLPLIAASNADNYISYEEIASSLVIALCKFLVLTAFLVTLGRVGVKYVLTKVVQTSSHELFTLTILALTFVIAVGSAVIFGASIALGAFVAGILIGETDVRHQVSVNATPLKDAFVVVFFLSVGMLFNPQAIVEHFGLFVGVLLVVMSVKPLIAYAIVALLKYPRATGVTVAVALAQIGEFSFILCEEAMNLHILPDAAYDIVVACAFISISFNPLLFKLFTHRFGGDNKIRKNA